MTMPTMGRPAGEKPGRRPRTRVPATLLALLLVLAGVAVGAGPGLRAATAQATIDCSAVPSAGTTASTPTIPPEDLVVSIPEGESVAFPAGGGELTVFAAASLANAFDEIGETLERENAGLTITFNYAGSQALVTQLTEGARADVFASANLTQMDNAIDAGLISGEPRPFLGNRLGLVVPADNPAGITGLADLANDDVTVVLARPDVPVGQYARQSLCLAGQDTTTYGEGFVGAVAGNIVSEEEDVRAVLTRVQLGEADAGIVYVSDFAATEGGGVELIEVPDAVNVVASYPVAAVAGGDAALAEAFISYLLSPEAQDVLASYGFQRAG
ncbi:MAG TPA: molybdate ABC transporter substrate-binding protein [Thermomicrobiales bacterium]|jgi:molybdate transport system substrate-binding protein|nr:molybdate ABC transporter substrate-binding protein [Thermomicrobiales bacterium]